MNVITRSYDFSDAPAKLQPNLYDDTQVEVVFQGRLNVLTKNILSYPAITIPGGVLTIDTIDIVTLVKVG